MKSTVHQQLQTDKYKSLIKTVSKERNDISKILMRLEHDTSTNDQEILRNINELKAQREKMTNTQLI